MSFVLIQTLLAFAQELQHRTRAIHRLNVPSIKPTDRFQYWYIAMSTINHRSSSFSTEVCCFGIEPDSEDAHLRLSKMAISVRKFYLYQMEAMDFYSWLVYLTPYTERFACKFALWFLLEDR